MKRLRHVIETKCPLRVLIPLVIESGPRRGKPGIRHWVAVKYSLVYWPVKDNVEHQVRFAYVKIGDSMTTGAPKIHKQYIFLISALCAMATSVIPRFLDEPSDNLTVAARPSGCDLPLQIGGNGCAAYTLATICGAGSRLKSDKCQSIDDELT
jgi:hypothetical protein